MKQGAANLSHTKPFFSVLPLPIKTLFLWHLFNNASCHLKFSLPIIFWLSFLTPPPTPSSISLFYSTLLMLLSCSAPAPVKLMLQNAILWPVYMLANKGLFCNYLVVLIKEIASPRVLMVWPVTFLPDLSPINCNLQFHISEEQTPLFSRAEIYPSILLSLQPLWNTTAKSQTSKGAHLFSLPEFTAEVLYLLAPTGSPVEFSQWAGVYKEQTYQQKTDTFNATRVQYKNSRAD